MPRLNVIVALSVAIAMVSSVSCKEGVGPSDSVPTGTGAYGIQQVATDQQSNQSANNADTLADSQEGVPRPIRDKIRSVPLSADNIEAALDAPLKSPLRFENQPLTEVMALIAKQYSLPIVIDRMKFEEIAVDPATPVTVDLEKVTLRSALNIILHQPGLEEISFAVLNEVLTITTKYECVDSQFLRIYPVEDFELFHQGRLPGSGVDCFSPLIHMIINTVSPATWSENGSGEGKITLVKPGLLIVRQEYRVHVEIAKLLTDLRQEMRAIEKERSPESRKGAGQYYDSEQPIKRSGGRQTIDGGSHF